MKIAIASIFICISFNNLFAQRLMDSSRSTIGYIENGRVMNSSRSTIGYIEADRIMNSSRSTIGYFDNGKVMNSSRTTLGYLENGRVMNSARSTIGYWENGRVQNSSRSTLGYYEGVKGEDAALFFFFFFYNSTSSKVPTISTTAISNLSASSAISGGNVSADGGATVTARGVVWSNNPTPVVTLSTKTIDGSGIGTFTSSLTSLNANTTYYVRAYATNNVGTAYGNEISFNLSGLSPQRLMNGYRSTIGFVENGRILDANRSIMGYFEDDKILNISRSIIGYFENGQVLNNSRSVLGYLDNGRVMNSSRSIIGYWENGSILNGSRSILGYYDGGKGEHAALLFFFFFLNAISAQIPTLSAISVSNISTTSAISGGNITADGGATVTARGVVWSTSSVPTISLPSKTIDGAGMGTFTSSLTSLNANTTYYMRAYATNNAGTAYSNEITFKTLAAAPTLSVTPTSLSFTATGGVLSLNIRSNTSWTITEGFEFIVVSSTIGSGDATVMVQTNANTSTQFRSGSILVSALGLPSQIIPFTQDGNQSVIQTATLTVDISKAGKAPKGLLGVNTGPSSSIKGYQEAGISEIRTHDYYGPFDYWHYTVNALDTTTKRFRSTFDATRESSYQWKESDAKMDTIVRNGFKPFFRLGISYPHHLGVPTFPPMDALGQGFQTFGEISRRTVMHYTKGWNNGFTYPIQYWEIWNEPDFKEKFWSGPQGTPINYFNLYKSTSVAIKEVDAKLKVGGPGLSYSSLFFKNQSYVSEFMAYCQTNKLSLDFYSWHLYDVRNPQGIKAYADSIRIYLDKYGFKSTESFITEINPDLKGSSFQNNARGAAWLIGAFISCNQAPVDKFFWYRGVQLSPLVEQDGISFGNLLWSGLAYKMYASFLAENNKTIPVGGELVISSAFNRDTTSLQALAGQSISKDTISVLISHLNSPANNLNVELSNIPWNGSAKMLWTRLNDPDRKMTVSETNIMVENGKVNFPISNTSIPGTCLIRIIKKQTSTRVSTIPPAEVFEIFPNPASEYMDILSLSDISENIKIRLIGLNGQQLMQNEIKGLLAGESIRIPLNPYNVGVYFLQIQNEKGIWVKQIEIIR